MQKPSVHSHLLENPVRITGEDKNLDFTAAKELAKAKARTLCTDPMLLSWYSGLTGESHPTTECGRSDKPPWIVYAEARGGDLTVEVNDGEWIFVFLRTEVLSAQVQGTRFKGSES